MWKNGFNEEDEDIPEMLDNFESDYDEGDLEAPRLSNGRIFLNPGN